MRQRTALAPALATLVSLAGFPSLAEIGVEIVALPVPAGNARLVRPTGVVHPPLVILLPETQGDGDEVTGAGLDRATRLRTQAAARRWAQDASFAPADIGLIGFGLGERKALAEAGGHPVAALYPRCPDLVLPSAAPVLILQGAADAAGCEPVGGQPNVVLRFLPDVGHGWEVPAGSASGAVALLPDPAGPGLMHAVLDHGATGLAAKIVAEWFVQRLLPGRAAP